MVKPLKVISVLDVGCGEGFTLKQFEDKKIGKNLVGVDNLRTAISIGKKIHPNLDLSKGDVYNLEFADSSFDLVLCTEVLEHLEDPKKAINEMKRVSKKYLVFSVPNEPFFILANLLRGKYLKTLGNHPEHINHWTMWGFNNFLKKQGLTIVKSRHPFAWSLILAKKT